jgi:predicted O-methyltransferase YrrM
VPFEDVFIPISAEAGTLLYALARAIRPETVIEFGTSFGISTIYLAAAVADNGTGRVVTTELNDKKAKAAQANLQAGVDAAVTILAGTPGRPSPTCPVRSDSSCSTAGKTSACRCSGCWNRSSRQAH